MMLVKVEAREFKLKQTIEELEETKAKLEEHSQALERKCRNRFKMTLESFLKPFP